MGTRKAPGPDGVTAEQLRALDEESIIALTDICNDIYETGYIPGELR